MLYTTEILVDYTWTSKVPKIVAHVAPFVLGREAINLGTLEVQVILVHCNRICSESLHKL